jgi:hypothetical protein
MWARDGGGESVADGGRARQTFTFVIPGHEPRSGDMNPESQDRLNAFNLEIPGSLRASPTPRNDD